MPTEVPWGLREELVCIHTGLSTSDSHRGDLRDLAEGDTLKHVSYLSSSYEQRWMEGKNVLLCGCFLP